MLVMMEKLGKGFALLAFSQAITVIGGFAINIFLTRYLGTNLYGQYSLVIVGVMAIGLKMIASGFPETMSKYIAEDKEDTKQLSTLMFTYQIIESVILTLIFMALSPLIAFSLDENELLYLIIIASLIIIGQGLISFFVCLYNGLRKFKIQAIIVSLLAIVKIVFVIIGTLFWGVAGAIMGFLFSTLIISLIFIFVSRKYLDTKLNFSLSKKIFSYMVQITLFNLGIVLMTSIDIIFIRYLLSENGNDIVGIYNAGALISRMSFYLIISLSSVMFPTISNLIANDHFEEAKTQIGDMIKIASIFLIPLTFAVSSLSESIVQILFETDYSGSAQINMILVFGYSLLGFFVIFSNIINAIGNVKFPILISLIIIAIDAILLYIFITYVGLIGATIATLISSLIGFVIVVIYTVKKIGIKLNIVSIIRINLSGIILFGGLNYIINIFDLRIYYWIPILFGEIVIYFLLLALFKDFNIITASKKMYVKYFQKKVETQANV